MVNDNTPRQPQPGQVEISWHCSCGASCVFTAEPEVAEKMRRHWEAIHTGEGHEETTEPEPEAAAARDRDINAIEDLAREFRWGRRPRTATEVPQ